MTDVRPPKWNASGIHVPSTKTPVSSGAEPRTTMSPEIPDPRATPGMFSIAWSASPLVPGMRSISWASITRRVTSAAGRSPLTSISRSGGGGEAAGAVVGAGVTPGGLPPPGAGVAAGAVVTAVGGSGVGSIAKSKAKGIFDAIRTPSARVARAKTSSRAAASAAASKVRRRRIATDASCTTPSMPIVSMTTTWLGSPRARSSEG